MLRRPRATLQYVTRLDPDLLLRAYSVGVFPMADSRAAGEVYWVEPKARGILPLSGFRLSRSLAKVLRSERYVTTVDHDFTGVVAGCAAATATRPDTWINPQIEQAYAELFARGHAHSIEAWRDGQLVGGLYGVTLGAAFFGESMFSRATDASKVALAHLVARLRVGCFKLLDCQFITSHLASLGAIEVSQAAYVELLDSALGVGSSGVSAFGDFLALDRLPPPDPPPPATTVSGPTSGWRIAQLLGQTS
ncbi:MAG: leucyl/phenylalanyl-tRNA--protein transferase [Sphingomonadales bacterium]|nr:MAG: leucyl/phenylalanyl-tRNA--protein transferase [Sphingomonadales bacterium]